MEKHRGLLIDLLCLCSIYIWLATYSYPYFFDSLAHNAREIQTYNLDSMVMLRAVESGLSARWFQFSFNDYGHFYFNLVMVAAYVYSWFLPLTEQALFIILRLFALLGGCCTIAVVYLFAKRYLGRMEAIFAALVLGFSPGFIEYSNQVKPDSWQVFFLTLSLYFLARAFEKFQPENKIRARLRAGFGYVLASSAAAGAAFGTKYQGIFLIPFLVGAAWAVSIDAISDRSFAVIIRLFAVLAVALGAILVALGRIEYPQHFLLFVMLDDQAGVRSGALYWTIQAARLGCFCAAFLCFAAAAAYASGFDFARYKAPLKKGIIFAAVALAFFGAFVLTSPWLLWRLQFFRQIYLRSDIASAGAWVGFRWLSLIFGVGYRYEPLYFAHEIGALSLLGGALLLVALWRRKFRDPYLPFMFVLAFVAIFLTLLIAKINFETTLYPLPIVPSLVLLAAFGLYEIRLLLQRWLDPRRAMLGASALTALLILIQVWQGASQLLKYPLLVTTITPDNRMLGDWLVRCVPPRTRMLAAAYSYAPPRFANVIVSMGGGLIYYQIADPDLVTVIRDEAASVTQAEKKLAKKPGYVPSSPGLYYNLILYSGAWRPGPIFGPYQVYVKKSATGIDPDCR